MEGTQERLREWTLSRKVRTVLCSCWAVGHLLKIESAYRDMAVDAPLCSFEDAKMCLAKVRSDRGWEAELTEVFNLLDRRGIGCLSPETHSNTPNRSLTHTHMHRPVVSRSLFRSALSHVRTRELALVLSRSPSPTHLSRDSQTLSESAHRSSRRPSALFRSTLILTASATTGRIDAEDLQAALFAVTASVDPPRARSLLHRMDILER